MTHFAKLDKNNTVVFVTKGRSEDEGKEIEISIRSGDVYKQTSYNTKGGVHYDTVTGEPSSDQSKALRKNYAGIGYTYDESKDAFIPPQPYASWTLNETSCLWEAPIAYPDDGSNYVWNESAYQADNTAGWELVE